MVGYVHLYTMYIWNIFNNKKNMLMRSIFVFLFGFWFRWLSLLLAVAIAHFISNGSIQQLIEFENTRKKTRPQIIDYFLKYKRERANSGQKKNNVTATAPWCATLSKKANNVQKNLDLRIETSSIFHREWKKKRPRMRCRCLWLWLWLWLPFPHSIMIVVYPSHK